ncbi:hypothetical protein OLM64_07515 [Pseudomonas aeruginosa]|uniref:hypothetical protein n=1 Tax=Pseudomonas aeruginosa TaxID=287 RepID=UPI00228A40EA|nr:hypothetical protein [Pseudomonas aeruginosa]MDI2265075.1 hypothetical protein [Pseudomonas aeruginosa]MDI2276246.1 hypothetical protein [Pseudomonas aeruginosa]MDI2288944.1 hypothetical protein [Pseudomonas aeruginosa]HCU0831237.1 hypothetical protein [Pseudomonas aeruginosa]
MLHAIPCTTNPASNTTPLTETEKEVIRLRRSGLSIEKIKQETGIPERRIKHLVQDIPKPSTRSKGAGRKPTSTPNPIYHIVHELTLKQHRPSWFDDILFGSCLTAAGQSGNISNVSIEAVLGALHMKVFSMDRLRACSMSKRKAQLVLQAARHAADGILDYLETRYPERLEQLEAIAKVESEWAYEWSAQLRLRMAPPPISLPVPARITALYHQGDYFAYGRALQTFRSMGAEAVELGILAA